MTTTEGIRIAALQFFLLDRFSRQFGESREAVS